MRLEPRTAATIGIAAAIAVGAIAGAKWRSARAPRPAVESTLAIRITQRDAAGLPEKKSVVREPARVRALVDALGVDRHESAACPPDYAEAPVGIVLSGADVYARRNVYVFGFDGGDAGTSDAGASDASVGGTSTGDAGAAGAAISVVSVTSAGCRVGPPADVDSLRREMAAAKPFTPPIGP